MDKLPIDIIFDVEMTNQGKITVTFTPEIMFPSYMLRSIDKHIANQIRRKSAPPSSSRQTRRELNELRLLAAGEYGAPVEDETTDSNEFNSL